MDFPINLAFVSTKHLEIEDDDGETKKLAVLVLDEPENERYWKQYLAIPHGYMNVLREHGDGGVKGWRITKGFGNTLAMADVASTVVGDIAKVVPPWECIEELYEKPVEWINSEEEKLWLLMGNDTYQEIKWDS